MSDGGEMDQIAKHVRKCEDVVRKKKETVKAEEGMSERTQNEKRKE